MAAIKPYEIYLGEDSAEEDIKHGLVRYFRRNSSYEDIKNRRKRVVVGNRGTGKSAIFKFLADRLKENGSIVIELSPEEYSYDMLSQQLKKESEGSWGKQSSYSIAWQYLIFNLIFKEIVNRKKGLARGDIKKIYDYVRDNFKDGGIAPLGLFVSYLRRLEGVKIGEYSASLKKRDLYSLYELQEIKELTPALCHVLESLDVNIFVDELDKGWDNSEDARYFIAGLLQAIQRINGISESLNIYVSIRKELFDNIPQIYDDAQKIRGITEHIEWSEADLLNFIRLRITDSVSGLDNYSDEEVWGFVFEETLQYRKSKSFNYLIDRTQLRPREFLQLVKDCIDQVGTEQRLVNYEDISKALITYSENKAKDLASEYRFQFPDLLALFNTFRGGKYALEKDVLDYHLLEICDGDKNLEGCAWARKVEYFELKKRLWEVGFLKAWVVGGLKSGRKSGSSYVGHYELSSLNLEDVTRFQIHPAFWPYFNLKEK